MYVCTCVHVHLCVRVRRPRHGFHVTFQGVLWADNSVCGGGSVAVHIQKLSNVLFLMRSSHPVTAGGATIPSISNSQKA